MGPPVEMDQTPEYVAATNANFYFPTFYVGCQPRERRVNDERDKQPSPAIASDALLDRLFETVRAPPPMAPPPMAPPPDPMAPEIIENAKKPKPKLLVVLRKTDDQPDTTRKVLRKRKRGTNQSRGKNKRKIKTKRKMTKGKIEKKTKNERKTKRLRRSRPQN